ncbi:hypothetical protein F5887DRAFT_883702 [Amanita rubescens]|nr:hypothetical protein F5887DRAFT_883702 [Amanita rubescens]
MSSAKEDRSEVKDLMYCRIVGHFFHHAPSDAGLQNLIQEVSSAYGDRQKVLDIGKLFYQYILCVFGSAEDWAPNNSFRPSFHNLADMTESVVQETTLNYETAKSKVIHLYALIRDGFKCVVTGTYDLDSAKVFQELGQVAGANARGTECVHIFSESTNVNISKDSEKVSGLEQYGVIHRLENVMTMRQDVKYLFDNFSFWFEPTEVENQYRLEGAGYEAESGILDNLNPARLITFTTPDPDKLPVPSREYLALHAACTKVAHFSGAGEYADSVLREMEDTSVLSSDGSSAAILDHAIWAPQCKFIPV